MYSFLRFVIYNSNKSFKANIYTAYLYKRKNKEKTKDILKLI